jgi:hypothetical protein
MGRNPVALYKRDRINPHPKKPNKRPHKRSKDGEDDQEVSVQPPAKAPMLSDFKLPEMAEITPDDVRTQPRPEFPEEKDEDATMTSTGPSLFFGAKTNQEGDDRTKVSASSYRTTKVIAFLIIVHHQRWVMACARNYTLLQHVRRWPS